MKNIIIVYLIICLSILSSAQVFAASISASDRIGNLATEERNWRFIGGGTKLIVGGVLLATGYSIYDSMWRGPEANIFTIIFAIPLGIIPAVPGAVMFFWGASDLLFGSREFESKYSSLETIPEPQRENAAVLYLKNKAMSDHQSRQPSFWNGFGLFSMFETPAEREYKDYLSNPSLKLRGQE